MDTDSEGDNGLQLLLYDSIDVWYAFHSNAHYGHSNYIGLLQLGPLSCMPVPGVTRGAANNLIVVKLVQPQSTKLE